MCIFDTALIKWSHAVCYFDKSFEYFWMQCSRSLSCSLSEEIVILIDSFLYVRMRIKYIQIWIWIKKYYKALLDWSFGSQNWIRRSMRTMTNFILPFSFRWTTVDKRTTINIEHRVAKGVFFSTNYIIDYYLSKVNCAFAKWPNCPLRINGLYHCAYYFFRFTFILAETL